MPSPSQTHRRRTAGYVARSSAAAGEQLLPGDLGRAWVQRLLGVVRQLGAYSELPDLLQHIASAAVEVLGFEVAAINVVEVGGDLRVVAVEGPDSVQQLRDQVAPRAVFDKLLEASEPWGSLRFLDHLADVGQFFEVPTWVAEDAEEDIDLDPGLWHPRDSLLAPMHSSTGELLGVLSVDRPLGGRMPTPAQRLMLELFAAEGANAIEEGFRRARIADSQATYKTVFALMPVGVAIVDEALAVVDANQTFGRLVGRPVGGVVGRALAELLGGDGLPLLETCATIIEGAGAADNVEHRLVRPDGTARWLRSRVRAARGIVSGDRLIVQCEDVTAERRELDELQQLANQDALTGLPNRRAAFERIGTALARRRHGELVCVMFCDLDGFKRVNDTYGHGAGDEMLAAVARSLRAAMRDEDVLFRLGGDEFLVLCERLASRQVAREIAGRLVAALGEPGRLCGQHAGGLAGVSMSVGVAFADAGRPARSAGELVSLADDALYRAKRQGTSRILLVGADTAEEAADGPARRGRRGG